MASLHNDDTTDDLGVSSVPAAFRPLAHASEALVVLELPTERILLATPAARALLAQDLASVVGRSLLDFTEPDARGAAQLVSAGHLNGFHARRARRGAAGELEIWARVMLDGEALVLALLAAPDSAPQWVAGTEVAPTAIGSIDGELTLDRVSEDIEFFLGTPPEQVLGANLLSLISPDGAGAALFGLAHAATAQQSVGLSLKLLRPDRIRVRTQVILLPLDPAPSCAIAIQPAPEYVGGRSASEFLHTLQRFFHGVAAARAARELTSHRSLLRPAMPELTSRELDIVTRLLAGDRVPAISQQLYLAQSTVRNHLSAVFAKLGVKSQQELIVLLRRSNAPRS